MKTNFIIWVIALTLLFHCSCESNSSNNDASSQDVLLEPLLVSDSLALKLDEIFSDNNALMYRVNDTSLMVINTQEELEEIWPEGLSDYLSLDTVTIIGVKMLTSSISDTISSVSLSQCDDSHKYNLEMSVSHCTECWAAFGNQYAWLVVEKLPVNSSYSLIIQSDNQDSITNPTTKLQQGKIVAYLKCNERETNNLLLGFFIITNGNDSLLSFNVPSSMYDLDINNLTNGIDFWDGDSIRFNYRPAELDEVKVFDCPPSTTFMPAFYDIEHFTQIVLTEID